MIKQPFKPGIKVSVKNLWWLFLTALIALFLFQQSTSLSPHRENNSMIRAANRTIESQKALGEFRKSLSIKTRHDYDPLVGAMIGVEFSPITTTLGELKAKKLSASPDFAALYIYWFDALGLKAGDQVIIHASGSFPALILAAICACEEWQLKPVIISSLGASSFGANQELFTWWDMESYLFMKELIHTKTSFATPGGQDDNGSSFWEGGMTICKEAAARNNLQLFIPENLDQSIQKKCAFIQNIGKTALFINIGGNEAATGRYPCSSEIKSGLTVSPLHAAECNGLIQLMSQKGIPVIHMLHIRELAVQFGLGEDAISSAIPGVSSIYFNKYYPLWIAVFAVFMIIISWAAVYFIQRYHSSKSPNLPARF